jgi:hypothetical protein
MAEWVSFLSDDALTRQDCAEQVEEFETMALEIFERMTANDEDDLHSDFHCSHQVAYLTLCDIVGHGVGFWSYADDYLGTTAKVCAEYSEFLRGRALVEQSILIEKAHELSDMMSMAESDRDAREKTEDAATDRFARLLLKKDHTPGDPETMLRVWRMATDTAQDYADNCNIRELRATMMRMAGYDVLTSLDSE